MVPGLDYCDDIGDDDHGIDSRYENIGFNDSKFEDTKYEINKQDNTRGMIFIINFDQTVYIIMLMASL